MSETISELNLDDFFENPVESCKLFINQYLPSILNRLLILTCLLSLISFFAAVISLIGTVQIRKSLASKVIINERIHFNYFERSPVAHLHLSNLHRQWKYINEDFEKKKTTRDVTLKKAFEYSIELKLFLSNSYRNFDIPEKVMINTTLIDDAGILVAHSFRPVNIPHRSPFSLHLESLALFLPRLAGLVESAEVSSVVVPLLPSLDPRASLLPLQTLRIELSSRDLDVFEAYLSILPSFSRLSSFLHHSPILGSLLIFSCLFLLSFSLISFLLLGCFVYYQLSLPPPPSPPLVYIPPSISPSSSSSSSPSSSSSVIFSFENNEEGREIEGEGDREGEGSESGLEGRNREGEEEEEEEEEQREGEENSEGGGGGGSGGGSSSLRRRK